MKRIIALLLACLCLPLLRLLVTAQANTTPSVSARHAVLYEPTTDTFLYDKDSVSRAPMASTTKIMTAYLAIKYGSLDDLVEIPEAACGIEGSSLYLTAGEHLTLRDLVYGLLLQSANDAAAAIAIHMSGSIDAFARLMNNECECLGLVNTHFVNPHGLDNPDHFTSARDLAKLTAAALDLPIFATAVAQQKYAIHCENDDKRILVNHNKLLRLYDDATGVKTGYTKKSGRCLVGAAEQDGLRLISVTLNAPDDWNDHISLFEYGFSQMENRLLCSAEELLYEIPSFNQSGISVTCTNSEDIYAILFRDAPAPVLQFEIGHHIPTPQKVGTIVGRVICLLGGKIIAESPMMIKEIHN